VRLTCVNTAAWSSGEIFLPVAIGIPTLARTLRIGDPGPI